MTFVILKANSERNVPLSLGDLRRITEALSFRARRHEAEARARPTCAGPHDREAEEMRKLCERMLTLTR